MAAWPTLCSFWWTLFLRYLTAYPKHSGQQPGGWALGGWGVLTISLGVLQKLQVCCGYIPGWAEYGVQWSCVNKRSGQSSYGHCLSFYVCQWLKAWQYMCTKSYWGLLFSKHSVQSVKGTFWSSTFPWGEVCINREAFNSLITLSNIKKSSYVSWKVDLNVF